MEKISRIREWLAEKEYDGVVLNRRDSYAFVTDGAKNHVTSNTETGVAFYLIEQEQVFLLSDNSDLNRISQEQNPLKTQNVLVPWYSSVESHIRRLTEGKKYVSDTGVAGLPNVQRELIDLRLRLSEAEVERYREVAADCAKIVEDVCREAKPGQTEREIAGLLKCKCIKKGISPDCVLVGADGRILQYRHPMPTNKKIEKSLMVVLGGEKYGLYTSLTRMVYFTEIPQEIKERYEKTSYIFACMQKMMREGITYSSFFKSVRELYEEVGYEEEWKQHHQGGPTGYGCREYIVTPDLDGELHVRQAYAWNPTIQGTKCEETTYLTESGIEILTNTGQWPMRIAQTPYGDVETADILVKKWES